MHKKINELAEQAASRVSRRGFVSRLGSAAAAVVFVGATLLSASSAQGARKNRNQLYDCVYSDGTHICTTRCPGALRVRDRDEKYNARLIAKTPVETCPY